MSEEIERLKRRVAREKRARKEAEKILELKSLELYESNQQLSKINASLEQRVQERTQSLQKNVEDLERINSELAELTHVVSHDLKSPLRAIGSLIGFLEEDLPEDLDNEDIDNYLSLIKKRVLRMQKLLNGILEYVNVGRSFVSASKIKLDEVLYEITSFYIKKPEGFQIKISDNFYPIYANRHRMQQVFLHLIENAVKYHHNPSEGILEIGSKLEDDYYVIEVKDNGPGIDPKYHEKVFKIFQLLETRDKNESSGLGLPIVKKIIQFAGGNISIDSAEGKGVKFLIKFPKEMTFVEG